MSKVLEVQLSVLKDVESQIRRTSLTYHTRPLDGPDHGVVSGLITVWCAIWMETLASEEETFHVKRWLQAISQMDFYDLLATCKVADELIIQSADVGFPYSYDTFKQCLKQEGCKGVFFISEAKSLIVRWFDQYEPSCLRLLRTLFLFPTKVNITSEDLREQAQEDYFATERANARAIALPNEEASVLESWFPKASKVEFYERFNPHHGNGSVAERTLDPSAKVEGFFEDQKLSYLIKKLPDHIQRWWAYLQVRKTDDAYERVSRVCFVPKSFKSYRTISMEPAVLMFMQEGFFEAFCSMIQIGEPWEYVGRRFLPDRQDRNAELALRGSIDGSFATIDLHAASDSVTWRLIKTWFKSTALYECLLCTRSVWTELPSGRLLSLEKFAPMGSALNFPVEVMVFMAITEVAIKRAGGDPMRSSYRVYGDDIIVETKYYDSVVSELEMCGFRVNHEKSFHLGAQGYFRESCGIHAFNGVDVTPLVCSRRTKDLLEPLSNYNAVIELANRFFRYGYRLPRALLVRRLLNLPQRFRPIFDENRGLLTDCAVNLHSRQRYNLQGAYQRPEILTGCERSVQRQTRESDAWDRYRLFEWLRRADQRSRDDKKLPSPYWFEEPITVDTLFSDHTTYVTSRWISMYEYGVQPDNLVGLRWTIPFES